MTPEQALENLYKAARSVQANAETHEILAQCYAILKAEIAKGITDAG